MDYNIYNNNGREVQKLIDWGKIVLLGPDFTTLVHRNGKPDIIFSNKNAFFNYAIERGGLASSDHFPVILKLSAKPIAKVVERKRCLKRTNWDMFKGRMEIRLERAFNLEELQERRDIDAEEIEDLYERWYEAIEDTLKEKTPTTRIRYYLHARNTEFLKLLELNYRNLMHKSFWTINDIDLIRNIQQRTREENLRLYREEWETKVENLNRECKDSSKFWEGVKLLIGNSKEKQEYILHPNRQNVKIYDPEGKEEIYRNIWTEIFSMPQEDNIHFDREGKIRVINYLRNNEDSIDPYQFADLSRLDQDNYLTAPFRIQDVVCAISKFKQKAPGKSGVNKLILSDLPRRAIECFALFTNY